MSFSDTAYYRSRATTERERASSADKPQVAKVHEELARMYEALAEREAPPTLSERARA